MPRQVTTLVLQVNPRKPEKEVLQQAAAVLRRGGLVAFPTETVYGLGASAWNAEAVGAIFAAKGRPADNPLIVHLGDVNQARELVTTWPAAAEQLAQSFWPGPLTLVLPCRPEVPEVVTGGLDTVALRVPAHPVALGLLQTAGLPVAAPSANLSGRPSPTRAGHVWQDLEGRVDLILDGGAARVGLESTVLDLTTAPPVILRPGVVTSSQVAAILGCRVATVGAETVATPTAPRSPGQKYSHYAPKARVYLVGGPAAEQVRRIQRFLPLIRAKGQRVGVLATSETAVDYSTSAVPPDAVINLGPRTDLVVVAANLYGALRDCDRLELEVVLAETFSGSGMAEAVMNRLERSAGHRWLPEDGV